MTVDFGHDKSAEYMNAREQYTLQQDAHGNRIVCKGDRCRNGYRIIWRGTYDECLRYKIDGTP